VLILALDTCDVRGSVAILRDESLLQVAAHTTNEDYSSWLLPSVTAVLTSAGLTLRDIDLYAVAAGPGSFTGVRVGLTTVKAWSEVYGRRIASVSLDRTVRIWDARPWTPRLRLQYEARNFIGLLYAKVGDRGELIRRIEQDTSLGSELRQEALEMTRHWQEDAR